MMRGRKVWLGGGLALLLALGLIRCSTATPPATTIPEQVHIAFGEDPKSIMRIMWQTGIATQKRIVEYGTSPSLGQSAEGIRPSYEYETGALAEVTLRDLKPDVKYFYRVGDPIGGWSPVYSFRTAPKRTSEFVFTAFGDHGVGPDPAKNVQNIVREQPAFHLLLGDVSYAGGSNQPVWDKYLRQIEPMASGIPYMSTLGNHENERITVHGQRRDIGYVSYLARFALPDRETWYSFDYGCARFVAFNSDDFSNSEQLRWLESTLSDARQRKEIKWLIVYFHHPLYSSNKGRGNNVKLIKAIEPLLDKYKVDLVLAGHDHHYERQYPIRAGQVVSRELTNYPKGLGTQYVVQGGGGKSLYDFSDPKPDICLIREKTVGYIRVTVRDRGPLTVESKRVDGSLIEKFEIKP
jgi:hypothetical protein